MGPVGGGGGAPARAARPVGGRAACGWGTREGQAWPWRALPAPPWSAPSKLQPVPSNLPPLTYIKPLLKVLLGPAAPASLRLLLAVPPLLVHLKLRGNNVETAPWYCLVGCRPCSWPLRPLHPWRSLPQQSAPGPAWPSAGRLAGESRLPEERKVAEPVLGPESERLDRLGRGAARSCASHWLKPGPRGMLVSSRSAGPRLAALGARSSAATVVVSAKRQHVDGVGTRSVPVVARDSARWPARPASPLA